MSMKRMTTSSTSSLATTATSTPNNTPQHLPSTTTSQSTSPKSKTLTDFSIKTIIGDHHYHHHHQQQHHHHSTHQAVSVNNPSATPSSNCCKILDPSTIGPYSDSESSQGDNELVGDFDDCQQTSEQETKDSQQLQSIKKHRPKNFQCPACKMAFSNNGQLKNHVRIHTGERPFRCDYVDCNKTFTRNEELTRHKLIHTGIRPHVCTTCGKRFGRKDHLKKHVRTHERKKLKRKEYEPNSATSLTTTVNIRPETFLNHQNLLGNPPPINVPQVNPRDLTSLLNHSPAQVLPSNSLNHTSTVEEQFADYWNKWYNLIGFYQ